MGLLAGWLGEARLLGWLLVGVVGSSVGLWVSAVGVLAGLLGDWAWLLGWLLVSVCGMICWDCWCGLLGWFVGWVGGWCGWVWWGIGAVSGVVVSVGLFGIVLVVRNV